MITRTDRILIFFFINIEAWNYPIFSVPYIRVKVIDTLKMNNHLKRRRAMETTDTNMTDFVRIYK